MDRTAIQWAISNLIAKDYQVQSDNPDIIQSNPWSVVYRFKTNKGHVYLKQVPPLLSLEPKVIKVLHDELYADVPTVIADSDQYDCFLMEDAGIQLHDYFKNEFNDDIFIRMIHSYELLQINSSNKIQRFFDLGVPDWRVQKLPNLYQHLISQESLLLEDGLTTDDLLKLNQLHDNFIDLCEQISRYRINDTFGHADFHDKNILIHPDTRKNTFIDLGEVVITHPFFSLHNCLYRAKENFNLSTDQHQRLTYACLYPWLEFQSMEHLNEIMSIISKCWSIHSALGEYRLMQSVNHSDSQVLRRKGRLANNLKFWLNQQQ